jgi:transcriptional regulator with XRE-family HTH domain
VSRGNRWLVEFGAQVRVARKAAGLRQAELGAAAGLSRASVSNIEAGVQEPPLRTAVRLATALGVPLVELLPESMPPLEEPPGWWETGGPIHDYI